MNKAVTHPFQKLLACRHRLGDAGHRRLDGRVTGDHRASRRHDAHTEAEHTMDCAAGALASTAQPRHRRRSLEAFCAAEVAAEQAFASEDPAADRPGCRSPRRQRSRRDRGNRRRGDRQRRGRSGRSGVRRGVRGADRLRARQLRVRRAQCRSPPSTPSAGFPTELPAGPTIVTAREHRRGGPRDRSSPASTTTSRCRWRRSSPSRRRSRTRW